MLSWEPPSYGHIFYFGKFANLIWRLGFAVNVTLRACLLTGPQKGEVTCGGSPHPSCKRDEMRDYMDRRACKQVLNLSNDIDYGNALMTNFEQQTLALPLWKLLSDSCSSMSSGMLISLFQKKKWRTCIQLKLTLPVQNTLQCKCHYISIPCWIKVIFVIIIVISCFAIFFFIRDIWQAEQLRLLFGYLRFLY